MNTTKIITKLHDQGIFSDFDIYFAKFMTELAHRPHDELLFLTTALLSYFTAQGHVCMDLQTQAEQIFPRLPETETDILYCPSLTLWLDAIPHWSVVGRPKEYAPLILDHHRLYFYRYWDYEQQLAWHIYTRLNSPPLQITPKNLSEVDEQFQVAHRAASSHFCIILGEPGTGKTVTVLKILVTLLEHNPQRRIALAAPTGKAAARLKQTLVTHMRRLDCSPEIRALLPKETYTLHRLLGIQTNAPHRKTHDPLPYDSIIVDEASMIDLALMTQLAQALPPHTTWILLGDKDQMNSVEAGTVLGDISETPLPMLQENIQSLQKNYRFHQESGIYRLAQAIKEGKSEDALSLLKSEQYPEVKWYFLHAVETPSFLETVIEKFSGYFMEQNPSTLLQTTEKFCILCATRRGPYGVNLLNRLIEQKLIDQGWINTNSRWYSGRPIMITRNDYTLNLLNGDLGIICRNPIQPTELQAVFPHQDHLFNQSEVRTFLPHRLPEHETVFAMTIHQSQGSEFEEIFILLPELWSPLFTRELLYTAVTRARKKVSIWGNEPLFKQIIAQKILRTSGLQETLLKYN